MTGQRPRRPDPIGGDAVAGNNVYPVSGSATLAGASVGTEAITSAGTLLLGGASAGNYTLAGFSGSVTVTNPFVPFTITSSTLDVTGTNFVVCWQSIPGVSYNVLTNTSLAAPQAWSIAGDRSWRQTPTLASHCLAGCSKHQCECGDTTIGIAASAKEPATNAVIERQGEYVRQGQGDRPRGDLGIQFSGRGAAKGCTVHQACHAQGQEDAAADGQGARPGPRQITTSPATMAPQARPSNAAVASSRRSIRKNHSRDSRPFTGLDGQRHDCMLTLSPRQSPARGRTPGSGCAPGWLHKSCRGGRQPSRCRASPATTETGSAAPGRVWLPSTGKMQTNGLENRVILGPDVRIIVRQRHFICQQSSLDDANNPALRVNDRKGQIL